MDISALYKSPQCGLTFWEDNFLSLTCFQCEFDRLQYVKLLL